MPYLEHVVFIYSTSVPINPCVMLSSELRRKLAFLSSGCWAVLHAQKAVAGPGWAEQPWGMEKEQCWVVPLPGYNQLHLWQQIVPGVEKTGWGRMAGTLLQSGISKCTDSHDFLWVKLLLNVWICRDTMQLLPTPLSCRAACLSSQCPFSTRYQQFEGKKRGDVPDSPISENCCDTHLHHMDTFKVYRVLSESGRVRDHTWHRMISSAC